ncbi:MAG: hypothetical protein ACE5FJ_05670 [Gemmatimonadales bacterium]
MTPRTLVMLFTSLAVPMSLEAQDPIESARSAAPQSISHDATIMAWGGEILHEGSNGWTCLPDNSATPGNDPWCLTEAWLDFLNA